MIDCIGVDSVNSPHPKAAIHYWRNLWPDLNRNGRLVCSGICSHADDVIANGFFGAELSPNFDCTQSTDENRKATHRPGVVFCYESHEETAEEGDCARYTRHGWFATRVLKESMI
jgi:hypothetical protein